MKVLVIPDVHLKPFMFRRAAEIIKERSADNAVCLMDIPDDWGQEHNLCLYAETFDAAIEFSEAFPASLWCYGNHDLSYIWKKLESGYSLHASFIVREKLQILRKLLKKEGRLKYIHRIDNVVFAHGGIAQCFVDAYIPKDEQDDIDGVIGKINSMGYGEIWDKRTPVWYRPQYDYAEVYKSETLLYVVGHTPVVKPAMEGNVLSCDVFSTFSNGNPIGTQEFVMIDTETWEWSCLV